jgi:hypothetical protein
MASPVNDSYSCVKSATILAGRSNSAISITGTDVTNQRVYQRVGTSKTITFTGTYTGAPLAIQVRLIDATTAIGQTEWVDIQSNPTGGVFSGNLNVPQGGWYKLQYRCSVNTNVTWTGTNKFGVGVIIAEIGQSNMANRPTTPYKYPLGDPKAIEYITSSSIYRRVGNVNDSFPPNTLFGAGGYSSYTSVGNNGDGHVFIANLISEGLGLPVLVVNAAIGGTSITTWQATGTSWTNNGSGAKRFKEFIQDIGGDFEMCLWHQGEEDAATMSANTYKSYLANVHANCKTLNGRNDSNFKFGVISLGPGSRNGSVEGDFGKIRVATQEYAEQTSGAFLAACAYDAATSDAVHITGESFYRIDRRVAKSALYQYGIGTSGAGPKIDPANTTRIGNVITVPVIHSGGTSLMDGNGSTAGTSITTFQVKDNGTILSYTSAISGNNIILTLASTPSGTVTLSNAYMNVPSGTGTGPITFTPSGTVYDNSLYYNSTIGCSLQPCAAFTVS